MKKKVLLVLFATMAMATVMSQTYDFSAVAPSGQTLYYSINGDVVSVVSGDVMPTGNLVIPDTVTYMGVTFTITAIGASAFYNCSGITSVVIPSTIITIGNKAFQRCNGITSITFSEGITTIGQDAFRTCNGLTSVTIPYSVSSIGNGAFQYSSGLTSIIIPSNSTTIGHYAFKGCSNLSSVTIMGSISQGSSFELCDNITYLNYDNRANTPSLIPHSNLQKVVVGNNVSSIPSDAFNNATNLSHVLLGSSVSSIGENAFRFCTNLDTIVAMPATAPTLGTNAFQGTPADKVVLTTCNANYATAWGTDGFVYGTFDGFSLSLSSNNPDYGSATFLQTIDCNQTAIIQATPAQNCTFTGWSDGNTDNPRTITLLQNTTLMANFAYTSAVVILQSADETMGSVSGDGIFNIGDTTVIMATAVVGYQFEHWSDGNTDNPRTITLTSDTTIIAYFTQISNNSDTVYVHDTTYVQLHDTTYFPIHDTIYLNVPIHDTTYINVPVYDTTYINIHDTTFVIDTVLYRYFLYDTIIVNNSTYTYDTSIYNHFQYDTTLVFDTMIVNVYTYDTSIYNNYQFDTVILNYYQYDTTIVNDTVINNYYQYDTTLVNVYDTTIINIYDTTIVNNSTYTYDTSIYNHFQYDTTLVFDTMIVNVYNYDTSIYNNYQFDTVILNYYQYDTTIVNDTVINNYYQYDTTMVNVYDTTIVNVYDTTLVNIYDTTIVNIYDTTINNLYQYDTVIINNYVYDTVIVNHYYYDTTIVNNHDTVNNYFYDTVIITHHYHDTVIVNNYVYDTIYLNRYIFDTVWMYDTVYIHDTIYITQEGIDGAEMLNAKVYASNGQIVVEGAAGYSVVLYDVNGRRLSYSSPLTSFGSPFPVSGEELRIDVPASGTYLIKIGDYPARKVVVIR